ncbi:MAG TPA: hypothetical protein VL171_04770, partial [Verrucomicrobiae bacterium]|nr:hypothetical protein [Verrucomicrobiae bacterium]
MEHRFHNAFVGWIIAQCLLVTNATASNVQFTVKIEELPAAFVPQEALIRTHIVTAATMWSDLVVSKPCKVDVAFGIRDVVENDPHRLGFGKSTGAISFGKDATGRPLFEQGCILLPLKDGGEFESPKGRKGLDETQEMDRQGEAADCAGRPARDSSPG